MRGDSFRRGKPQNINQRSVYVLERRKRAQRIRDVAYSGDSFRRGKPQNINQRSVYVLERRKRAQRIRGSALSAGTCSVEAVSDVPPAAPSFPPCRKRRGRKGALGRVWCVLRVQFRRAPMFQSLRTHILTLRALWYAPPVTGQQVCEQLPLNGCCKNTLRSKFAKQSEFAETLQGPMPASAR